MVICRIGKGLLSTNLQKTNMKQFLILKSFTRIAFFATFLFASSSIAYAFITPTLNLSATGNGDSVQLSVTGDANASVILYYTPTNSGMQIKSLGTTNSSGTFSTTLSSASYQLTTGNPTYVSIGGVNGVVSTTVSWPTVNTTTSNLLTLNQAGLVLSVGQTGNVTATNNTQNSLYISNNSNPSVASAAVSGNQITILATGYGSTIITVCPVGSTLNCRSVSVTVQNGSTQTLTLSQSNVSLAYGQSTSVTISGGTGSYIVSNNSSSGTISTSISGNVLVLGGSSNTSGTYSVTVCSSDMSSCGIVNVTLGNTTSSNLSFSQPAPVLSVGQSMAVLIYGNTSTTYYISSNSNPSVAQSSIANNVLTLLGSSNGTTAINVCPSVGGCTTLTVTVSNSSNTSPVYLAQSSLTVAIGQTLSVAVSGGTTPYVLLTPSNTIFQAGVSGSTLYITGLSVGSAQITVCSSTSTGCSSLSLQVAGTSTTSNNPAESNSFLRFSAANPMLNIGQNMNVSVLGGSNNTYRVAYTSNQNMVQASINGNSLSLYGLKNGYSIIVICDGLNNCGSLPIIVGGTTATNNTSTTNDYSQSGCLSNNRYNTITGALCISNVTTVSTTDNNATVLTKKYQFTQFLQEGMSGNEILELQQRLTDLGYYHGPVNGTFGPLTAEGVASFQRSHGVSSVGYVGPSTRKALNAY